MLTFILLFGLSSTNLMILDYSDNTGVSFMCFVVPTTILCCDRYLVGLAIVLSITRICNCITVQGSPPSLWTAAVDHVCIKACSMRLSLFLTSLPCLNSLA